MAGSSIFLLLAILIVGILVFVAITISQKKSHAFDKENYQTAWLKIENSFVRDNKQSYQIAVINADKLLDKAMNEMGVPGKTMGERLKKVGAHFSDVNAVWRAHKIRNMIAHESDFDLEYTRAKNALAAFRQALKDLGAI